MYTIEYDLVPKTEYKNFVITTDEFYLVAYYQDKKNNDVLGVYLAGEGLTLHSVKLQYPAYNPKFTIVPMTKNPHWVAIIDSDKGTFMNIRDKKFVRSVQQWNGRAIKDDAIGLYAPTRGGLELLDLKSGKKTKVLIPKVAEGLYDVDTLITENDKHVIYYHTGKRTIRAFRLEDGKKIADYKSTASVLCMVCSQDSKLLVFGCEDGTVNVLIIADPEMEENVNYLREWRSDQVNMFMRDGSFLLLFTFYFIYLFY
jgi:hypothetical protein